MNDDGIEVEWRAETEDLVRGSALELLHEHSDDR
jgi:hypothetical protein